MDTHLPGVVLTGASGFIGRNFIEATMGHYRLFCLARRSPREAGIPQHDNLRWTQVDIAEWDNLCQVERCIKSNGGADYIVHLAGYYDFDNTPHPEYERTNYKGTRNVLKLGKLLGIERFIFSSSLAACKFTDPGELITEDTPPAADFPYARSKRRGEELMKEHTDWFSITILRLAAVFSDWCEYPPLYMFLKTWLSGAWNANILGGKGESAIPYLHIRDLISLINKVIEKSDSLPRLCTYNASPSGSVSHMDLYKTATRYYYGVDLKPVCVPKKIAFFGLIGRQLLGRLTGNPPFERLWMVMYIDKKLDIDASGTFRELAWRPTERYGILRRLLFLIENMKTYPEAWNCTNEAALRRIGVRPNFIIHDALLEMRDTLLDKIYAYIRAEENAARFPNYFKMNTDTLKWYIAFIYQLTTTAVRTRDRSLIRNYAQIIAQRRYIEKFDNQEVCDAFLSIGRIISDELKAMPKLSDLHQRIYDYIDMTFQMANDEIEEYQDRIKGQPPEVLKKLAGDAMPLDRMDLERLVHQFEDICQDMVDKKFTSHFTKPEKL